MLNINFENNDSENSREALKQIQKYLKQLEEDLKSGKIGINEFNLNNHIGEIGSDSINRKYSPTGRRTLKIIYYEKS